MNDRELARGLTEVREPDLSDQTEISADWRDLSKRVFADYYPQQEACVSFVSGF